MTIEEMQELDDWCAEHVLHWKRLKLPSWEHDIWEMNNSGGMQGSLVYEFHPTTVTGHAAAVQKACAEAGHVVTIECCNNALGQKQWLVAKLCHYSSGLSEDYCTCAPTFNEAICLFAKKIFTK